jgi:hypothetical protein
MAVGFQDGVLMTDDRLTSLLARLHDADDRIAMGLPQRLVNRLPVDPGNCVSEMVGRSPLARAVRTTTAIPCWIPTGRVKQLTDGWRGAITSPTRQAACRALPFMLWAIFSTV